MPGSAARVAVAAALLAFALSVSGSARSAETAGDWRFYGNDANGQRFSALSEIDRSNVQKLAVAWRYHAGGGSTKLGTAMECTPLVVGGRMYVTSPDLHVIALDAATGRELWRFDPFPESPSYTRLWTVCACLFAGAAASLLLVRRLRRRWPALSPALHPVSLLSAVVVMAMAVYGGARPLAGRLLHAVLPNPKLQERRLGPNRGLTYWEEDGRARIFFAGGHRLVSIDAENGQPVRSFGQHGFVDLTEGLSRPLAGAFYAVTSPGVICRKVLVLGSSVGEGPGRTAPGDVRGFDLRTGRQLWTFHTVPRDGMPGAETWPQDAYRNAGGTNAWAGMVADEARGLVFVPTGSPAFDYYGGDRAGDNLYSDSLVALHAEDGTPAWHYQMVRHDLWDYDLPCPPVLVTLQRRGQAVDAVVQPTKQGFLFVLDRASGRPLFPVEERRVPVSGVPGEYTAATQPMPVQPRALARQGVRENDLTDLSAAAHAQALAAFRRLDSGEFFAPPSLRGTLVMPGWQGGVNWGGASYDPVHARLVINTSDIPYRLRVVRASAKSTYPYTAENFDDPFVDDEGYPAIRPPWGRLSAVNLQTGDIEWQTALGEYPELTKRGIPPTGMANIGGSLQTAGGLIFIAATKDRRFRAFDAETGNILWSAGLSAAGHASPATYAAGGRQFVVIAAGGGSIAQSSPSGDEYVAFALPGNLH